MPRLVCVGTRSEHCYWSSKFYYSITCVVVALGILILGLTTPPLMVSERTLTELGKSWVDVIAPPSSQSQCFHSVKTSSLNSRYGPCQNSIHGHLQETVGTGLTLKCQYHYRSSFGQATHLHQRVRRQGNLGRLWHERRLGQAKARYSTTPSCATIENSVVFVPHWFPLRRHRSRFAVKFQLHMHPFTCDHANCRLRQGCFLRQPLSSPCSGHSARLPRWARNHPTTTPHPGFEFQAKKTRRVPYCYAAQSLG